MTIRVLMIENHSTQFPSLQEAVRQLEDESFQVRAVQSTEDAVVALTEHLYDVMLIDLQQLNPSISHDLIRRLHTIAPDTSIVLAGQPDDDAFALQMVEYGVQQFIRRDKVDGDVVQRALRHAVARTVIFQRFAHALSDREREAEMGHYERMGEATLSVSERLMGTAPLKDVVPDVFHDLMDRYKGLLDMAMEQQAYHVSHDLTTSIRDLAVDLGRLRAGPRDVIHIHSLALKESLKGALPERAQAILEESRVLVIELMGDLVQYYRNLSMGIRR